jgi:hypothetical protein
VHPTQSSWEVLPSHCVPKPCRNGVGRQGPGSHLDHAVCRQTQCSDRCLSSAIQSLAVCLCISFQITYVLSCFCPLQWYLL